MKLVTVLPNWIGDAVMATPALQALHALPHVSLIGVMRPVVADLLSGVPWFTEVRTVEKNSWGSVSALRCQLRTSRPDAALLFTNSFRTAWWMWCAGVPRRIGFQRNARGWLLTHRLLSPSRRIPYPVLHDYAQLAATLGADATCFSLKLVVTRAEQQAYDLFWQRYGQGDRRQGIIAFNTGGAYGPSKSWPTTSFAALARTLLASTPHAILVLCGPQEYHAASEIVRLVDHPRVFTFPPEMLSIGLTKAALQEALLLITTDSGPRHVATALGVPTVTLFGPTDPRWSETFSQRTTHVRLDVPCSPCQRRVCPFGHHRCMRDLSVAQVADVSMQLWEAWRERRQQEIRSLQLGYRDKSAA
ncbi:MAG: ADP-heptose--LPS heptosyltransferase [Planctomycetaceae bacterium]|nr:MAG: ADP-heptose--LPS heptosyltransferase [Planctomycetaceae bacterium]